MNLLKLCRMMSDYKKENYIMWKKIIPAVAVLSTITFQAYLPLPISESTEQNRYIDVQMLGINDLHGQLDTVKKSIIKFGGADYLATYLKNIKTKP